MYDCDNGLLSYAFKNDLIKNEYGIKAKCTTMENPQYTSILNIRNNASCHREPCTYIWLSKKYLDENNLWSGILEATDFTVPIMHHTKL